MKWPKLLSTGFLALVFVILTGLLARGLAERFRWGGRPAGRPWPRTSSMPEDSMTPIRTI